jgi:hypothetical protein
MEDVSTSSEILVNHPHGIPPLLDLESFATKPFLVSILLFLSLLVSIYGFAAHFLSISRKTCACILLLLASHRHQQNNYFLCAEYVKPSSFIHL